MSIPTLIGLAVLALGALTGRSLRGRFKANRFDRKWMLAESLVFVCGLTLGIIAIGFSRYPTPNTRLLGLPFVAAVFERSPDGHWADFVGMRTLPATLGNFIVGFVLPHIPFAWVVRLAERRHHAV